MIDDGDERLDLMDDGGGLDGDGDGDWDGIDSTMDYGDDGGLDLADDGGC